jgi:hypothetical protein
MSFRNYIPCKIFIVKIPCKIVTIKMPTILSKKREKSRIVCLRMYRIEELRNAA